MLRISNVMPIILMAVSLPAYSIQPESPRPDATHRIHVYREGKGEPRVRDTTGARSASSPTPNPGEDKGRTRPYQVAKPGEGAPKR
jgi:hypothetical protein